ncbi:MAG: hypothetical protein RR221_06840 [Alistipes sp.]
MAVETSNFIPLINGVEYSWGDITATIGGVPVIGITAIEYGDDQVVENHYGAGRYPVSRSKGRVTPSAKITLTMGEVVAIQAKSLTGRLQDLAPFPIVVAYIPEDGQIVIDKIMNCQFKKNARTWKEGDTRQAVDLDLVPSHIAWHKI